MNQTHKQKTESSQNVADSKQINIYRWGQPNTQNKSQDINFCNLIQDEQNIKNFYVGENHGFILMNTGEVLGFGNNEKNQINSQDKSQYEKCQIVSFSFKFNIVKISCGCDFTLFLDDWCNIYGQGDNSYGQLGLGYQQIVNQTRKIDLKDLESNSQSQRVLKIEEQNQRNILIKDIYCGTLVSCIISTQNKFYASGFNQTYQLGLTHSINSSIFQEIKQVSTLIKDQSRFGFELGVSHAGLLIDRQLYLWGMIGQDQITILKGPQLIRIKEMKIIAFCTGMFFTVVCFEDFSVFLIKSIDSIIELSFPNNINWLPIKSLSLTCGLSHFIIRTNIGLFCGGNNNQYQFGWLFESNKLQNLQELDIGLKNSNSAVLLCKGNYTYLLIQNDSFQENKLLKIRSQNYSQQDQQDKQALLQKIQQLEMQVQQNEEKMKHSKVDKKIEEKDPYEIDFMEIENMQHFADGGVGRIYLAKWRQTQVAVKILKKEFLNNEYINEFVNECKIMQQLRHPNIVTYMGACKKEPNLAIVLEFCSNQSLFNLLQKPNLSLGMDLKVQLMLDIAWGMNYLHKFNPPILHWDLKSLNVLIDSSLRAKLGDFGWTKPVSDYMTNKIGTFQWMAPEVIQGTSYNESADVYSYGIIVWEICHQQPPFKHLKGPDVAIQVIQNNLRPKIASNVCQELQDLMEKCWCRNPKQRLGFQEIIMYLEEIQEKIFQK